MCHFPLDSATRFRFVKKHRPELMGNPLMRMPLKQLTQQGLIHSLWTKHKAGLYGRGKKLLSAMNPQVCPTDLIRASNTKKEAKTGSNEEEREGRG